RCIQDRLGGPAEKSVVLNGAYSLAEVRRMYELQPEDFTISPNELGSISFTGYSAGDRRKVDRCFNLDALVAEMKLGDPNISGQGLINAISLMQVYVNLPEIPRDLSISQEAIAFYEEGIKNGDPEFIDAWFEVVIRGIRKAVNLGVNQYEERSMQETKRLCSIAAERWVQGSHDSHTLIKNFRELEVAMTVYRNKTTSLMDIMGIRPLFQLAFKQYGMSESKSVSLDHMKSLIQ
ncbi:hypothetical protein HY041_00375, partial [Candidatus Roizmanbacteria bacterium]|nr:hypothetical protein [Candidatus Roizmanbacteria bacterium]